MKQYLFNERILDVTTFFTPDRVKRLKTAICDWAYSPRAVMREEMAAWATEQKPLRELTTDEALTMLLDELFAFYLESQQTVDDEDVEEFVSGTKWPEEEVG